jgi:hypothetical protein
MISPEDANGRRILFRFLDYDPLMDSSNMTHIYSAYSSNE